MSSKNEDSSGKKNEVKKMNRDNCRFVPCLATGFHGYIGKKFIMKTPDQNC